MNHDVPSCTAGGRHTKCNRRRTVTYRSFCIHCVLAAVSLTTGCHPTDKTAAEKHSAEAAEDQRDDERRAAEKTMCEAGFVPRAQIDVRNGATDVIPDSDADAQAIAKKLRALVAQMRSAVKDPSGKKAKAILADADVIEERASLLERAGKPSETPPPKPVDSNAPPMTQREKALKEAAELGASGLVGATHLSPDTWKALNANQTKGEASWLAIFDACYKLSGDAAKK